MSDRSATQKMAEDLVARLGLEGSVIVVTPAKDTDWEVTAKVGLFGSKEKTLPGPWWLLAAIIMEKGLITLRKDTLPKVHKEMRIVVDEDVTRHVFLLQLGE